MKKFQVSMTYSNTTPESREQGNFSETGFVWENQTYNTIELIDLINSFGYYELSDHGGKSISFYGDWFTQDYTIGEDCQECLHVDAKSRRDIENLLLILRQKQSA